MIPIWGFGVTGYGFVDAQYPRILAETGILGLAIFCFLIYRVFLTGLVVYRHDDDGLVRGLSMGLIAGLVGLLVHGVGANTFTIVRIMEPFWLTVGLVTCAGELQKLRDVERVETSVTPAEMTT